MAASNRLKKFENELTSLEARFETLLLASLRRCERGRWGMFGSYGRSEDGEALLELVASIDELRARLGYTEPNVLCSRFLEYRRKRGPNDLGEPKLAAQLLAEILVPDHKVK